MGAVTGMLGLNGGAGGTGFSTNPGVSGQQINDTYGNVQHTAADQAALLNALQNQNGIANQNQVYNQTQGIINGTGPNPAQAMLNQTTGQNVANQAALMAGQRGASANPGLIARQAAQQGANIQQQAAGQAATLQAQQSLNAIGQASGLANQMASNQIGQTNQNNASQQALYGQMLGTNSANNQIQGQLANTQMGFLPGIVGGALNAAGGVGGLLGGTKKAGAAEGGMAGQDFGVNNNGPKSMFAQAVKMSGGSNVGDKLKEGGHVPGKAQVKGDSYKNDNVKAMLSPNEIVLPRSITMSKDPVGESAKFVAAIMAKKGMRN